MNELSGCSPLPKVLDVFLDRALSLSVPFGIGQGLCPRRFRAASSTTVYSHLVMGRGGRGAICRSYIFHSPNYVCWITPYCLGRCVDRQSLGHHQYRHAYPIPSGPMYGPTQSGPPSRLKSIHHSVRAEMRTDFSLCDPPRTSPGLDGHPHPPEKPLC